MILILRRTILPALFLVACTSLQADVTMRMSMDLKVNMTLPGALPELPFKEIVTRIKGDRSYAAMGSFITVVDNARGEVTLIDTKTQSYAIIAMADYLAKLQQNNLAAAGNAAGKDTADAAKQVEAAKQMLAKMKFDVASHDTGRTDRMGGIDVFEREVVINMSIPVPLPGQENGLQVTMKLQTWKPKPAEFDRLPALRELAVYNDRNQGFNNPATLLQQAFSAMPGMSESAGKMVDEITKGGKVMLGMHMGFLMPGLAKMMEQARAQGANVPDLPTGDKPLAEVSFDLKELSTDSVPAGIFVIPSGYKEASVDELVKGMLGAFAIGKK